MAVKIRFTRIGRKHAPVYRIVAADSRKKRDGRCLENLGTYNPLTKEIIQFHDDRIAHWISVGAVVNDSVQRLIKIRKKQLAEKAKVEAPAKKAAPKKEAKKAEAKPAAKKAPAKKPAAAKAEKKDA